MDSSAARSRMVESQLRARGIIDARVLAAMGAVPREQFVPDSLAAEPTTTRRCPSGTARPFRSPTSWRS